MILSYLGSIVMPKFYHKFLWLYPTISVISLNMMRYRESDNAIMTTVHKAFCYLYFLLLSLIEHNAIFKPSFPNANIHVNKYQYVYQLHIALYGTDFNW